jgi:hypothetical protein
MHWQIYLQRITNKSNFLPTMRTVGQVYNIQQQLGIHHIVAEIAFHTHHVLGGVAREYEHPEQEWQRKGELVGESRIVCQQSQ